MVQDPGDVLNSARKAFSDKDYATALEKYEWFFDNSVNINPSYYGVRLSYCLDEWANLAEVYSPAKEALLAKKCSALDKFNANQSLKHFHEYANICEYLKQQDESVEQFLKAHITNSGLAEKMFRYVYEPLARNEEWKICRQYMGNGHKRYLEVLEIFDYSIEFSKKNEGEKSREIEEDGIKHTKLEFSWLLNMLSVVNIKDEYESALKQMQEDLESRGYHQMYQDIVEDILK